MVRIFITGVTGYIGGEALSRIVASTGTKHQISALVRDAAKVALVQKAYPQIRIVNGDLDDVEAVTEESKNADIVFHLASTNHAKSANAIATGLTDASRSKPGYWIQISGASVFSVPDIKANRYGEPPEREYDDLADINAIISAIKGNSARVVDNLVLSQDALKVRTALVIGPLFYGTGSGPGNKRSVQAPEIARVTLEKKKGFKLGRGLTVWSNCHVRDLGDLFVRLLEAADGGDVKEGIWNQEGIFTPENGNLPFGELSRLIAAESHSQGLIDSPNIEWEITAEETNALTPHGAILWGTNTVVKSSRARKYLGWTPSGPGLEAEVAELVRVEAKARHI